MMRQSSTLHFTDQELQNIFVDNELLEKKSFFIIEELMSGYDTKRKKETYLDEIKLVREAYLDGCTIVVKNMENYNYWTRHYTAFYGRNVDACMFFSPREGSGLGWHTDLEDVHVHGVRGTKMFLIKDGKHKISPSIALTKEKFTFNIPPNVEHMAKTINGPSIHMSFGIKQKEYYLLGGGLTKEELGLIK